MIDMLVLSVVSAIVIAITATIGSLIRLTFYDNDKI